MNSRKLNVGIFTHDFYPYIGGQGRYLYEFYKKNKTTNEINLFFFSPAENNLKNHIRIIPESWHSKLKNIEFSVKLNFIIEELIKKHSLDISHFQGGPGGVFLFKKLSIPTVYTSHHTYWQQATYIPGQRWKWLLFYFERRGFELADQLVTDCESTKKILKEHYRLDKNIEVIPIGIDPSSFKPVKHSPAKSKNLLYVGRIDKRKGVDFLIQTMVLVNKSDKEVMLHIVGKGKDQKKLEEFSNRNNLNVIFHGFLTDEELSQLYETIAIQIVPSIFEGFGLTVLESMSRNIPVIATNVDGIKDIIKHRDNGTLVNYGKKRDLASAIEKLLGNNSLKARYIQNGHMTLNSFNWEKYYQQNVRLYEQINRQYSL